MTTTLTLPDRTGKPESYKMGAPLALPVSGTKNFNRIAYAAAHVVSDPLADNDPFLTPAIDWDRTISFREHLWDLGLGVAEAMDTAQRGMGLGWAEARELISRALAAARSRDNALIACGAGTDHLQPGPDVTLDHILRAYEEQVGFVEGEGGRVILMASRALAQAATGPDDYVAIYDRVLSQVREPVIIHWLGEMFDPALEGYWGAADHDEAMNTCLDVLAAHAAKIDGIKISLLSKDKEIAMRRRLPQRFHDILAPTVALSRHIFAAPTRFYKTGVVFIAYLNGLQDHFTMVGGQEGARSTLHLAELFRLADKAGILLDPERAAQRMQRVLAVRGLA